MMVKICGITNLEDAQAAAAAGASAVGFNFYVKSPRYLIPEKAVSIIRALPESVWKVGVFVNESGADVAARIGLDIVQIHGEAATPTDLRVWRAVSAGTALADERAEAFLVDTPAGDQYGGTGRTFDWNLARDTQRRIILAGGLDASNVSEAIRTAQPWGVDACSRIESAPGKKDH